MKALFITDDYIIDPLGIAWLSAYLKQAGHQVELLILDDENNWDKLIKDQPDMLCYSVTTGKHVHYQSMNSGLRMGLKQDLISVFGGPHVTFFPEYLSGEWMDIGVRGEGFDALVDIANALQNKESLQDIPNLVIDGKQNPLRPLRDKNDLLLPDRNLIYERPKNRDNPIKNVMASFSCMQDCPYCQAKEYRKLYGLQGAEIRDVGNVMEEIDDLLRFPLELIFFQDDIFPLYKKAWLESFCEQYKKFRIPFHIQVRAEYISGDNIRMLKSVGLHGVTFAIESGNVELRKKMLNRKMSNQTIKRASDILHRHDVKLRTENMVGIPGETWETVMETLNLNVECSPTIAWASLYQPYPGTDLGNLCIERGLFDGNFESISESFFDTYRLDVEDGSKFEKLQKLFSLMTKYPALRVLLPLLIWLPFRYKKLYSIVKKGLYRQLYKVT